ncbi:MAG: DMT family transporter [Fuerstiella sp.]|jgi:drug/metabolite transporter (DMT)-like permease|nr:DMT family transporter [Fuerstiella sp.]MCP4506812.1 DMT family transporter [Fuerstiella sp.]MDG2129673.1 DMT family transporter [Fuerstiella sp.]
MGTGETAALAAAAFWAAASLLYGKTNLSAWGMNLGKNVLASLILLTQLYIMSSLSGSDVLQADLWAWSWLGLSGVVGIMMGDTCYFRSLQILGPRKALIVSTTAPVFAAVLGYVLLDESVTVTVAAGMFVTTGAVAWVVSDGRSVDEAPGLFPGSPRAGIAAGILGAICQAVGAVCSKIGMQECDPVEASLIRLSVSAVGALVIVAALGQLKSVTTRLADLSVLRRFVPAVIVGTWLGIWLSQVAFKHASVSVAVTLLATTPLFAIPLVRIFYGHRVSGIAVVGTILAIVGVYLVVS